MATFVITFFLITRFCVWKMDADSTGWQRDREISRREKRWSMSSQRTYEILSDLLKSTSDIRQYFDMNLSGLLEEYLTEVGLRAVEEADAPNYAEVALVVQHSACIYSRMVDFVYCTGMRVSDSLRNNSQVAELEQGAGGEAVAGAAPAAGAGAGAGAAAGAARRRRPDSAPLGFAPIELQAHAGARRGAGPPRPPPYLPRAYIELEPRVLVAGDVPLCDYDGEPLGLLSDFQVTWRLQDGLLVDELEDWSQSPSSLRAMPLTELHAAIEAAAPPSPPPCHTPPACSTPLPPPTPLALPSPPTPPAEEPLLVKKERKRRNGVKLDDIFEGEIKLQVCEAARQMAQMAQMVQAGPAGPARGAQEFSLPARWVARVLQRRTQRLRAERARLRAAARPPLAFRGFDISDAVDIGGFAGWSATEGLAACARRALAARLARAAADDSDDDGFFELSDPGDPGDPADGGDSPHDNTTASSSSAGASSSGAGASSSFAHDGAEWAAWREAVLARAAQGEARAFSDMQAAGARLLRAVQQVVEARKGGAGAADAAGASPAARRAEPPRAPDAAPFPSVLAVAAEHPTDVSRVFLATLFLANAGNVEIVQGAPLSMDSFALRLVSADDARFRAAAADDLLR